MTLQLEFTWFFSPDERNVHEYFFLSKKNLEPLIYCDSVWFVYCFGSALVTQSDPEWVRANLVR